MVYGVTILKNAPNPSLALKFMEFVLSDKGGKKIMEENGQPSILRIDENYKKNLPENLKSLF